MSHLVHAKQGPQSHGGGVSQQPQQCWQLYCTEPVLLVSCPTALTKVLELPYCVHACLYTCAMLLSPTQRAHPVLNYMWPLGGPHHQHIRPAPRSTNPPCNHYRGRSCSPAALLPAHHAHQSHHCQCPRHHYHYPTTRHPARPRYQSPCHAPGQAATRALSHQKPQPQGRPQHPSAALAAAAAVLQAAGLPPLLLLLL